MLLGTTPIAFDRVRDIVFRGEESLPEHPNAMRFTAFATDDAVLAEGRYFSVGGGFVVEGGQAVAQTAAVAVPHPFATGDELMAQCRENGLSVAALVLRNECAWRPEAEVRAGLLRIWGVMQQCVQRGFGIDNPLAAQALPGLSLIHI